MGSKLKILLVEDNILNQRVVTLSLRKYQHEVIIANNGLEAIEKFSNDRFDVILMDIMMPVMDGIEATKKIREIENNLSVSKKTPIIALTANTMDNDREKCISYGMNEFMEKPLEIEKLYAVLQELEIVG
jgi:osomolarity two-component system sensor histidine kinase NIK1